MNAAVENSRNEQQRRRPLAVGAKLRGSFDAPQALPVLIRVPNLDAPRAAARTAIKEEARTELTAAAEASSRASQRATSGVAATRPSPRSAKNLIGWTWRMLILAAAVGLVMLAYRIINGPATVPPIEPAPPRVNVVAESHEAGAQASPVGDIAAPSTLAPPTLELQSPPVQISPAPASLSAIEPDAIPTETIAQRNDERPRDDRRPWASDVRMEQPRGEGAPRTARAQRPGRSDRNIDSTAASETDQASAATAHMDQQGEPWDAAGEPGPSYVYPETTPDTWRNAGEWEAVARRGAPRRQGQGPQHAQDYPQHTMRPDEPGVARLRGGIEQPIETRR